MMEPRREIYAQDWIGADPDGGDSLTQEERRLAGQLQALGRADEPDPEFMARLAGSMSGTGQEAASMGEKRNIGQNDLRRGVQRAWQWSLGLAGMALLVGILIFSINLLPRSAGSLGPAQPSLPGQVFTPIPGGPTATPSPQIYVVQDGDTWASIAARFGMNAQELVALNGINDASELRVGQTIWVEPQNGSTEKTDTANEPTEAPALEAIPAILAPGACPLPADLLSDPNFLPSSRRPEALAGGGSVESGNFSFDMWLACSSFFKHGNTLGDPYTEIEGLGFIASVINQGPALEGSVVEYAGIEPYVRETGGEFGPIENGMAFGELQGLQFPPGIIPDLSQSDTHLRYLIKVKTPDGAMAGAALAFTLQREAEGYRPVDVVVEPLAEDELQQTGYDPSAPAPFPTIAPEELYPELAEVRASTEKWQAPLLSEPGWLRLVTRQEEPGGNGLYGSLVEWTTEDWYQIDERGYVIAFVTTQRADDGRVLQQVYAQNGQTVNLTFGGVYAFTPYRLELNSGFYLELLQWLKMGRLARREETQMDGRVVLVWTLSDEAERRVQRETFDAESGAHLLSELANALPGGKEELVWRYTYEVTERAEPPAEILGMLGQEFQGYVPPPPDGTPAPTGFDPSSSELTWRTIPGDSFERPTRFFGDIYAGSYLLGRVDFGARPDGNCDRSADGAKLAYSYEVVENERTASAALRWLDLRDLPRVHEVAPELILLGRVFWSPVSDQIAFSACTGLVEGRFEGCGVYLYDLPGDQVRLLTDAGSSVWDILWKPDGTQVAFVSTTDDSYSYFVLDAASAEILDQGAFDADAWQFPASAPVNGWGVSFPRGYEGTRCFSNP